MGLVGKPADRLGARAHWDDGGGAAAAALIYSLTPELMRDQAGHGPEEADWTGRKEAENCSYSSTERRSWVVSG